MDITVRDLMAAGLSRSYAHHVLAGTKTPAVPLALWLLDKHNLRVRPLVGLTETQIKTLRAVHSAAAPTSILRRAASEQRAAA